MGYALWIDDELAWAQGTYEYRALGCAVIARTQLFRQRDFSPRRRAPEGRASSYVGLFASMGEMNEFLRRRRSDPAPTVRSGRRRQVSLLFRRRAGL